MDIDIKSVLRQSTRTLLRPIASMLLKAGMTWKEFSDISKTVFVSVATEEFGIRGRPTNISRTSILTGVSRKEVKRQREFMQQDEPLLPAKTTDATRLLSAWHQDPLYTQDGGMPRPLPGTGPAPSFQSLFESYGGDTPEQTLLKELETVGSVELDDDGLVYAKRRYHMPVPTDAGHIQIFCSNLNDHARTLCNNLYGTQAEKRLEGVAVNHAIDPDALDDFRKFMDEAGQRYLEEIDAWLSNHSVEENNTDKPLLRLGLGVYAIEETLAEGIPK